MDSSSDSLTDLSSELSSIGSRSPTPPFSYPSPQSSQTCGPEVADPHPTTSRKRSRTTRDEPQRKKRRTEGQRPRTTEHLDLRSAHNAQSSEQAESLNRLLHVLRKRRKIVVIAGAGISTSAGVPDFRSSNGLFNTLRAENKLKASGKHLFDASVYQTDSSTSSFHDMVRELSTLTKDAKPTEFHQMLATLADEGRLLRLYTQNVDGIDTALPPLHTSVPLDPKGPWPRTIQLHGSLEKMVCSKCSALSPFDGSLFNGPLPPPCGECVIRDEIRTDHAGKRSHGIGRLRPRMVLYNEHNPDEEAIGRVVTSDLRARPDAIIVVGTSLEIPGVKRIVREMCSVVRGRKNGMAVWINRNSPPVTQEFKDCWDLVVAGDCDRVAKEADMRRWNEEPREGFPVSDGEAQTAKAKDGAIQVVVQSPKKPAQSTPNLPTPAESPRLNPISHVKSELPQAPKVVLKFENTTVPGFSISSSAASKKPKKPRKINHNPAQPKKPRTKAPKPTATPKISGAFKITKAQPVLVKPVKKPLPAREPSIPMGPISPQSARNNGPIAIAVPDSTPFVKLDGSPESPSRPGSKGRLQTMSEEIVTSGSPPPRGMENLLN